MAQQINQREIWKYFEYNDNESTACQNPWNEEITEINETEYKTKI